MSIWILAFFGAFHAVPALRLALTALRTLSAPFVPSREKSTDVLTAPRGPGFLSRASFFIRRFFEEFEYAFSTPRLYLMGIPLAAFFAYEVYGYVRLGEWPHAMPVPLAAGALVALNFWGLSVKRSALLKLAEYLRQNPRLHPTDFFALLKRELAFGTRDVFSYRPARQTHPENADFRRNGRSEQVFWRLFVALIDTFYMTSFIIVTLKKVGPSYSREISDLIGHMWGKRLLQLARGQLVVEGAERLSGLSGKFLLVFNHMSSLDFVFTFFALSDVNVGRGRFLKPRFIVAKDHFKDNPFLYRVIGIGRAIETMDMVFIERKNRGKSFENLRQAAVTAVLKEIDVAIYPQGTRAVGNFDRAGKRRDAGYYTTVSPRDPSKPLAHLKKGTGYLVFDVLKELRDRGLDEPLHLVFIGIRGTANALPRGSLRVQTESTLRYKVGDVVSLNVSMLDEALPETEAQDPQTLEAARARFAESMNYLVDQKLCRAMNLHESLKKRFLTDLKGAFQYEPEKIQVISVALDKIAERSSGVYQIIDRIYSLPPQEWNGYLSQFCQLLQGRIDEPERFQSILRDVSEKLVA